MIQRIICDIEKTRLDRYLSDNLSDITRSQLKIAIIEGKVLVNSKASKPSFLLSKGDIIDINIPNENNQIEPVAIELDILYEDDELAFVNKPKGMVVHPGAAKEKDTLAAALLHRYGHGLSDINGSLRPGIVHRIDKDTTGVLVIAKNNDIHKELAAIIKEHKMDRIYRGIVVGRLKEEGRIETKIGRNPKNRLQMSVVDFGKEAITYYKPIQELKNRYTYTEFKLETGRTHQIRVHMKAIHHPILGDLLYGKKSHLCQGQALHAYSLGFMHPRTNKYIKIIAKIPEYLENIIHS